MVERIVLYGDDKKLSPLTERVEIALLEAGAQYTLHTFDLFNKPAYYTEKINLAGKIPALTYGGPDVPPDQPSPDSVKIPESLVLLEFVADLFPSSGLLPSSPVERANVRLFIDVINSKLQGPFFSFLIRGESTESIKPALEQLQSFLLPGANFAVGNHFTIADAALAPLLWRLEIYAKYLGGLNADHRDSFVEAYQSQRFEKLRTYFENIKLNKNFKHAVQREEDLVGYFRAKLAKAQ